jgi:hypothetical protein
MPPIPPALPSRDTLVRLRRPRSLGSECRYTDEIRFGQRFVVGMAQILVDQRHLPVRWRQTSRHKKPERLPDSISVQAVPANVVQADYWIAGIYEIQAHVSLSRFTRRPYARWPWNPSEDRGACGWLPIGYAALYGDRRSPRWHRDQTQERDAQFPPAPERRKEQSVAHRHERTSCGRPNARRITAMKNPCSSGSSAESNVDPLRLAMRRYGRRGATRIQRMMARYLKLPRRQAVK